MNACLKGGYNYRPFLGIIDDYISTREVKLWAGKKKTMFSTRYDNRYALAGSVLERKRARERERVCVCVYERERENEREYFFLRVR